jgi:hypothetical protein
VSELQALVATTADAAGAHSTAPALLLQIQYAIGEAANAANEAIDGGRRPFRVPHDWDHKLGHIAYLLYRLADQSEVNLDQSVHVFAQEQARLATERLRVEQESGNRWI